MYILNVIISFLTMTLFILQRLIEWNTCNIKRGKKLKKSMFILF